MGEGHSSLKKSRPLKEITSYYVTFKGLAVPIDENLFNQNKEIISLVSGMDHSLAILRSGEFISWGSNHFGQLGTTPDLKITEYILEPASYYNVTFPKSISRICIISISAGTWHSACVSDRYQVFTWGQNTYGQLGIEPETSLHLSEESEKYCPFPINLESLTAKKPIKVNCGSNYTLVTTEDKRVFSFGKGQDGALGTGYSINTYLPQEITCLSGVKLKKIACGFTHCLALTVSGQVYQWGTLLKDIISRPVVYLIPEIMPDLSDVHDIACGDYHCGAVEGLENSLLVWGSNGYGQLGNPEFNNDFYSTSPLKTMIDHVHQITCGGLFTCVKLNDHSVLAWGCNRQKQIGSKLETIVAEPCCVVKPNAALKRVICGYSSIYLMWSESNRKDYLFE